MITSVVAYLGFEFGEKQTTNSVVHEKPHVASINIDYNIERESLYIYIYII